MKKLAIVVALIVALAVSVQAVRAAEIAVPQEPVAQPAIEGVLYGPLLFAGNYVEISCVGYYTVDGQKIGVEATRQNFIIPAEYYDAFLAIAEIDLAKVANAIAVTSAAMQEEQGQ